MEPGPVASVVACPIREMRVALHVCDKDVHNNPNSPLLDDWLWQAPVFGA
jgi:hypothetical protein